MSRLAALQNRRFDLLIIGGGINGAGIAREAARRGLSVALIEKLDYAAGTTSRATRLIHGGVRYLEHGELLLVLESLREREALLKRAPHLVRPLPFLIPVFQHSTRSARLIRAGMVLYDLLSAGKRVPRHRFLDQEELKRLDRHMATAGLKGAFLYYDGQVTYAERLAWEAIAAARAAGAVTLNHCRMLEFALRDSRVTGARVRDLLDGRETTVEAQLTVNACGPWLDETLASVRRGHAFLSATRGTHLALRPFEGCPSEAIYFEAKSDRRPVFVVPWNGLYLVGTTDILDHGRPDEVLPTAPEVEYLLSEAAAAMPQARLTPDDILYTYAGLRPLPHAEGSVPAELTRRHLVFDHEKEEGIAGLASLIGGKLTTYRELARDAVRFAERKLGREPSPPAEEADLPFLSWHWDDPAQLEKDAEPLARSAGVAAAEVIRLLSTYGAGAKPILARWKDQPPSRRTLCEHSQVTEAEVLHAAAEEQAITPADALLRRTCAGLGPCRGLDALPRVAELLGAPEEESAAEIARTLVRN
jgi:glycerol-3-phosphate dehydrogenase